MGHVGWGGRVPSGILAFYWSGLVEGGSRGVLDFVISIAKRKETGVCAEAGADKA